MLYTNNKKQLVKGQCLLSKAFVGDVGCLLDVGVMYAVCILLTFLIIAPWLSKSGIKENYYAAP